jgi:hypothetical protein
MFRISPRSLTIRICNTKLVHGKKCKPDSKTVTSINFIQLELHVQMLEFRWSRRVRCIPYYLIAVHEEAGDECAHAKLIADGLHLRYKDTSLPASSEMTRTLLRTESWVSAWLESCFRSTSELLLDVVDEEGGTT